MASTWDRTTWLEPRRRAERALAGRRAGGVRPRRLDPEFQPNGDISLFDDHGAGSGPARGVEYELDLAGGTARLVWQYLGNATSSAMGSFRRYPDGDSVIGWGASTSSTHAAATEVDASGRDPLDLSFTSHGNWAYRAVKVPIDAFDINALRNTAGLR